MSRRRNYPWKETDVELTEAPRTRLPIEVAPVAVEECVATGLDPDGTRDAWTPPKQSPIDVKRHLEDLVSDWDLANPNKYCSAVQAYGVLLLFHRQMSPTGWRLLVTVSQNHYLNLARKG